MSAGRRAGLEQALEAAERGESVIAVGHDKRPWYPWKRFQTERATPEQIRAWAQDDRCSGFAVITGAVSGLVVLDFDGAHGIAQCEALGLDPHVRTPSGGFHVRFRHPGGRVATLNSEVSKALQRNWHGLDIRGDGGYAMEWGANGQGPYETLRDLDGYVDLESLPHELLVDLGIVSDGKIRHPGRHAHLLEIAGAMVARGETEGAILAELRRVNARECEPPKPDHEVVELARDVTKRYSPTPSEASPRPDDFTLEWGDPTKIRRTRWLFRGWIKLGCLNCIYATGGTGRTTICRYLAARVTQGELPGEFEGKPSKVLWIGDEDTFGEATLPAIMAMGGNAPMVANLSYSRLAFELVRDIEVLKAFLTEHQFRLIAIDQVLDHIPEEFNSHSQQPVRAALAPLRSAVFQANAAALYGGHMNKRRSGGDLQLRDLAGGSGQFVDLARSGMILGYHPERGARDEGGWRGLARAKGNFGAIPPSYVFRIEASFVANPARPDETAEVAVVEDLYEDPDLQWQEILTYQPKPKELSAEERAMEAILGLGANHKWRAREAAITACTAVGINERVAREAYTKLAARDEIETRQNEQDKRLSEWRIWE